MKYAYYILFVLTIYINTKTYAQERTDILEAFNIENVGKYIKASCIIKAGNTCAGIKLYRSTDSLNFNLINILPGVCGYDNIPAYYELLDTLPIRNTKAYYKMEFGGSGFTEILAVEFFDFNNSKIEIWPNPIDSYLQVYIENLNSEIINYTIIDNSGIQIYNATTIDNSFKLNVDFLSTGLYTILFEGQNGDYKGYRKFLKN